MGKIIASLAVSLDGFIADEKGGADWLNEFMDPGEDYGMKDFFKNLGTIIMGSKTYDKVLEYGGSGNMYKGMDCIVYTSRKFPSQKGVQFLRGDPTTLVAGLRKNKKNTWLMGGGILIADFLDRKLVDELSLAIIPVILGKGISLWPGLKKAHKLKLVESKSYKNGVLLLTYKF